MRLLRLRSLSLQREDAALLDWLGAAVARRIPVQPIEAPPLELRPEWWDGERGQYASNAIVDHLSDGAPEESSPEWTLAVTSADLFAPGREFVFGEATRGGGVALLSLSRLRDGAFSGPDLLLRERALKEALHEIGHLAGVEHCSARDCAMTPSSTIADVDAKPAALCDSCALRLEQATKGP